MINKIHTKNAFVRLYCRHNGNKNQFAISGFAWTVHAAREQLTLKRRCAGFRLPKLGYIHRLFCTHLKTARASRNNCSYPLLWYNEFRYKDFFMDWLKKDGLLNIAYWKVCGKKNPIKTTVDTTENTLQAAGIIPKNIYLSFLMPRRCRKNKSCRA